MSRRIRIAVVDYGAGNLVSIEQALAIAGAQVRIARDDLLGNAEPTVTAGVISATRSAASSRTA